MGELSKREIVLATVQEGGATMESLQEAADCKYESVMSIFSTLRLMGFYPVKDVETEIEVTGEDGELKTEKILTYRIADKDEWDKIQEDKKARAKANKRPAKTPAERLEAAQKKVARCEKAAKLAKERADKDESSQVLEWKAEIARLEVLVANEELADAQMAVDEMPEPAEPEEAPEATGEAEEVIE